LTPPALLTDTYVYMPATHLSAFDDTYQRDDEGIWRYTITGQPVPGARDLTLANLYRFPVENNRIQVPAHLAATDPALSWCLNPHRSSDDGPLTVTVKEWDRRAAQPLGIDAPELHPSRLITIAQVASLAGVEEASIHRYLLRGAIPQPPIRVGYSPCWPRPIIDHWLETRRTSGRRQPGAVAGA
jgi:predicted DNA-binding transcriptional regulator AlpA